jgi:TatD DNase family protein
MMLVDTHAHLDFPELADDLEGVLTRAANNGIGDIITIGIGIPSSRRALQIAQGHDRIFATAGIHPHGACPLDGAALEELSSLAQHERVVAIGEIGLDYYRDRQPRDIQQLCFRQQLELAVDLKLPVVIHVRDAYDDFLRIIASYASFLVGAVMHCYSGDWAVAERCLDMGFLLSFPGTVTFTKAHVQQQVASRVPLERMLLETDAPFLAPEPYRGKPNEPSYLLHTARKIAALRGLPLEELAQSTTRNARRVFRLELAAAE